MARKRTPKRVATRPHEGDEIVRQSPKGPNVVRVIAVDSEFVTFRIYGDGTYTGVAELSPADWTVKARAAFAAMEGEKCG